MPPRTKGRALGDLYDWHLLQRAMRRPLADIFGLTASHQVRWLAVAETVRHNAAGFSCESLFCRRGVTCVAFFDFTRRGQLIHGETFLCTAHAERRASRLGIPIEDPPQEGDPR